MSLSITTVTKEYVFVPVTVDGATPDTGLTVEVAIPSEGVDPSSWVTATWDSGRARVLVGSGGDFELSAGRYDVWVRITDSPELTARNAGLLIVN